MKHFFLYFSNSKQKKNKSIQLKIEFNIKQYNKGVYIRLYILNTIHFSSIVSAKMYADNFPYITDNVKKFRELLETKYKDTIEIYDERPKDKTVDTESRYFYLNLLPLPEDSRYKRIQIRISDHPKNYSKFKSEFNIAINDMVFSISHYENPV